MIMQDCILRTPALPSWTHGAGNVVPHHHTAPAWRPRTFEILVDGLSGEGAQRSAVFM